MPEHLSSVPIDSVVDIFVDEFIELVDFIRKTSRLEINTLRSRDKGSEAVEVIKEDTAVIAYSQS